MQPAVQEHRKGLEQDLDAGHVERAAVHPAGMCPIISNYNPIQSIVQRLCEELEYSDLIDKAVLAPTPLERLM